MPESAIDYRALLDTTGELEIGAYARRVRRRRAFVGICGVVLLALAWMAYWALQPRDERTAAQRFSVKVLCTKCGAAVEREATVRDALPLRCPRCDSRHAQVLWTCRACNSEFTARKIGQLLECPHCHSMRVGSSAAAAVSGSAGP